MEVVGGGEEEGRMMAMDGGEEEGQMLEDEGRMLAIEVVVGGG